jgi:hypothetical protein
MTLSSQKALELIDRAIELGGEGRPKDFREWQEATRLALRLALGDDSSSVAR